LKNILFAKIGEKKTIRGLNENLCEASEANSWVENLVEATEE